MIEYLGELKIKQENREIIIPYKILNLWGKIHIYITDKDGLKYSFYYNTHDQIWICDIRKCPKWPTDFSQRFFRECDKARLRHGV
jgi:hypothetical protein